MIQFALQAALECTFRGDFTLERLVEAYAHAPAARFAIKDRGFLREGYFADLVLVDPHQSHTVGKQEIQSKCGWSPFTGDTFRASIAATFVNGNLAARNGKVLDTAPGMRLAFEPR